MGFNDHFLLDLGALDVVDSDVAEPVAAGQLLAIGGHLHAPNCIRHFSEPVVVAREDPPFKGRAILTTVQW